MNKELSSLEKKRHTLAHLLASAVRKHYPHAKPAIGPAIESGFYYDFDFSGGDAPGDEDLKTIESEMKAMLPSWKEFSYKEISAHEAKDTYSNNPFKLELIDELEDEDKTITLYTSGTFTDLCRGGHSEHPSDEIHPDTFELSSIAGAYWRGNEKNPMLTRIYGIAFDSKEDLDAYKVQMEEAKKRDHRKLGKEMDLFTFSELVGGGLPLWTPNGTIIRNLLDEYIWELRNQHGYKRVTIPHITKKDLYETSGHWEKFGEELMKIKTREGKEYALKPMNCPHHTQIFDRRPHSYKDMPQRYAETTMVYRDEQSGELGGLTRVLSITQDDSHVFCRHNQIKEEFFKIWDIVDTFYSTFGFDLRVRLSFHDTKTPEKYLGTPDIWKEAESALRDIAKERNAHSFEAPGEAALYGPKLDFMALDAINREHQVATIQLDMNLPERFNLTCINEKGERERIAMIHCAVMGSIERFAAVLIEHVGGNFPLWLSPKQIRIIPVSVMHNTYATEVYGALKKEDFRAQIDLGNDSMSKKIRNAKLDRLPYFVVVGDKEVETNSVTLEKRDGQSSKHSVNELITKLQNEISEKTLF